MRVPLAVPVIMAGVRTAAVINVGTATLAAFVGGGGLGDPIVAGLALADTRMVLSGAIPAALLACVVDVALAAAQRLAHARRPCGRVRPRGSLTSPGPRRHIIGRDLPDATSSPDADRKGRRMSARMAWAIAVAAVGVGIAGTASAQPPGVAEWRGGARAGHRRRTARRCVAMPNVAGNDADMRKNADHLPALFTARGFTVETIGGPGSPVVFASLDAPSAVGTLTFYIHYDGQPVDAAEWTRCKPFTPCLWSASRCRRRRSGAHDLRSRVADVRPLDLRRQGTDRGAAERGGGAEGHRQRARPGTCASCSTARRKPARPTSAASPTARPTALKTDLAVTLDGPRHPSGRPTVYFGVRGGAGVTLTVYGAKGDVHSGNYGNWAPDPSMRLAKLLATMKDDAGRVLIKDFYRDVRPLTATERQALDAAPNVEAVLQRDFGVAPPERPDQRLEAKLNEPTLSVLEMSTSGIPGRSAIPGSATARIEVRMVKDLVPETQNALITEHVRAQGYYVVSGRDPSDDERRTHALIARVDARRGSTASRVSMDDPKAQAVVQGADDARRAAGAAADARRRPAVRHLQRPVPDADRRRLDRELRQQPARPRREPAAAEPVGGHRDAGQPDDDAGGEVMAPRAVRASRRRR